VAEAAVNGLEFAHPERVHLFWPAALVAGFLAWRELGRGPALRAQLSAVMQRRLVLAPRRTRRLVRAALAFAALGLGILALMQPQARGDVEMTSSGRASADVMVVLDVSRSMLADDAPPTRLARAKAEVGSLVDRLDGHRVGLVAFAGRAAVQCPLTPDHAFFHLVLSGLDTRSAARGGTRIGDGLRRAVEAFGEGGGARVILLITDGEDQDSQPLEAAKAAAAAGVRVVAIGFGSEQGSQIRIVDPDTGERSVVTGGPGGSPVVSKLDGELLRQIALATRGAYVPAGTAALDLESILAEHVTPIVQAAPASARPVPVERYPWFALGALVLLVAVAILGGASERLLRRDREAP
jgi:Ca-activated chloride channel family protein